MNLTIQDINSKIYTIRDTKVMIDSDLAILYEITTGNFNKSVSRNLDRFPGDFMFELNRDEFNLMFQNGISSYGGRRKLPRVFTEQGIAMLSSILRSKVAIGINIKIMRTFVEIRRFALTHDDLAKQIAMLDSRVSKGEMADTQIMEALTQLIKIQNEQQVLKPSKTDGKIGFAKE